MDLNLKQIKYFLFFVIGLVIISSCKEEVFPAEISWEEDNSGITKISNFNNTQAYYYYNSKDSINNIRYQDRFHLIAGIANGAPIGFDVLVYIKDSSKSTFEKEDLDIYYRKTIDIKPFNVIEEGTLTFTSQKKNIRKGTFDFTLSNESLETIHLKGSFNVKCRENTNSD